LSSGAAGDVNGDGNLDLVVPSTNRVDASVPYAITAFLGNGDGTFKPALETALSTEPVPLQNVVLRDFNGDGKLDVATSGAAEIELLIGKGNGTFDAPVPFAATGARNAIAAGDFNGDGIQDVTSGTVVLIGTGKGAFGAAIPLRTSGEYVGGLATGDFAGDGYDDIAIAGQSNAAVYLHCAHPEKDAGGDAKGD
jgi:hypothetical protein